MREKMNKMGVVVICGLSGLLLGLVAGGCEWDPGHPDAGPGQSVVEPGHQVGPLYVEEPVGDPGPIGPPGRADEVEVAEPDQAIVEFAFPHLDREPIDHVAKARALLESGDQAGGMLELEKALYDEPASYTAAFLLGKTARDSSRSELAVDAFMLAAQIDPEEDDPWVELARISLDAKLSDQAEQLIRRALRLDPRRALSHNVLGRIWLNRSHWDRAIARFEKAVDLSPGNKYYRNNLGFALLLKRDYLRAVEVLEPLAEKPSVPAFMYNNLGLAYEGAGRLQDSVVLFKLALEANPRYVNARVNLDRLVQLARRDDPRLSSSAGDGPEEVEDDLILPESDEL